MLLIALNFLFLLILDTTTGCKSRRREPIKEFCFEEDDCFKSVGYFKDSRSLASSTIIDVEKLVEIGAFNDLVSFI